MLEYFSIVQGLLPRLLLVSWFPPSRLTNCAVCLVSPWQDIRVIALARYYIRDERGRSHHRLPWHPVSVGIAPPFFWWHQTNIRRFGIPGVSSWPLTNSAACSPMAMSASISAVAWNGVHSLPLQSFMAS